MKTGAASFTSMGAKSSEIRDGMTASRRAYRRVSDISRRERLISVTARHGTSRWHFDRRMRPRHPKDVSPFVHPSDSRNR